MTKNEFTEIYCKYIRELLRIATKYFDSRDRAEDACANVFTRFWEKVNIEEVENIHTFLCTSIRNECLTNKRYQQIRRVTDLETMVVWEDKEILIRRLPSAFEQPNPEELLIIKNEYDNFLMKELKQLPEKCKMI
jgi:RNA polymerase sigma factor (sigma-70 family)